MVSVERESELYLCIGYHIGPHGTTAIFAFTTHANELVFGTVYDGDLLLGNKPGRLDKFEPIGAFSLLDKSQLKRDILQENLGAAALVLAQYSLLRVAFAYDYTSRDLQLPDCAILISLFRFWRRTNLVRRTPPPNPYLPVIPQKAMKDGYGAANLITKVGPEHLAKLPKLKAMTYYTNTDYVTHTSKGYVTHTDNGVKHHLHFALRVGKDQYGSYVWALLDLEMNKTKAPPCRFILDKTGNKALKMDQDFDDSEWIIPIPSYEFEGLGIIRETVFQKAKDP
jgi:hypothetical protein